MHSIIKLFPKIGLSLCIFGLFSFIAPIAHAYVYVPDVSFDSDGFRYYHQNVVGDYAEDVVVQSDNKIVVTGSLTLVRFNSNGTLDATFGTGGVVNFTDLADFSSSQLALQSDGKILVVGSATIGPSDERAVLLRYNTDGTLDTSFDSDGYVYVAEAHSSGSAVKILSSGAIVISGFSRRSSGFGSQMSIWKFTSSGTVDTTFDTDGVTHFDEGDFSYASAYCIDEQSDNKLVLAGYADDGTEGLTTWRYNADGSIDTSFSTDGFDKTYGGYDFHFGLGIAVRPTGEIVVGGYVASFNQFHMIVEQYTTTGVLDSSFGTSGQTIVDIPGSIYSSLLGMELLANGQLSVAGRAYEGINIYPLVARFTSTGHLDTDFYGTGYHMYTGISGDFFGLDVVGGSTVVAVGGAESGSIVDMLVMRAGTGYQFTMPTGLHMVDSNGNNVELGEENGVAGTKTVTITDSAGHPIVDVEVYLTSDVDWDMVSAATDLGTYKSFVDGLTQVQGITGPHALYVPKAPDDNYVYFCPYATSLAEVTPTCQDGIRLTTADGVSIVTSGGQEYWKIEGAYATGGLSAYDPALAPTGAAILIPMLAGGLSTIIVGSSLVRRKKR